MALPNWQGASAVYSRAYRVLEALAKAGHVTRTKRRCTPSEDVTALITALAKGEEELIKGLLLTYRDRFPTLEA